MLAPNLAEGPHCSQLNATADQIEADSLPAAEFPEEAALKYQPALVVLAMMISSCGSGQLKLAVEPVMAGRFLGGVMAPSDGEIVSRRRADGEGGAFEVLSLLRNPTYVVGQRRAWAVLRTVEFSCQPLRHRLVGVALYDEHGALLEERPPTVSRYSGFDPLVAELCTDPQSTEEPEFTTIADYIEQARALPYDAQSAEVTVTPAVKPKQLH